MSTDTIHKLAEILHDSFGEHAQHEAERREKAAHDAGDEVEAADWKEVREVLVSMQDKPQG